MRGFGARFGTVTIALALCLITSIGAQGARLALEVKSLRGVMGVHVVVESLAADLVGDGLTTGSLEKTITDRLTAGGIRLLSEDELSQDGAAIFYISLASVKSDKGLYACDVHAEVIQAAALTRDPHILTPATTWTSTTVGMVGASNVRQLNDTVGKLADEFVRDYLSVNSKQQMPKPKIA
jgi:hypothetical protein